MRYCQIITLYVIQENKLKIDFVLPWVNNQDIDWQNSKKEYDLNQSSSDSNAVARYRDMGTLKYVLRSIEKNCPWYNKIYLITCGHYPEWLNLDSGKVVLVKHTDIYDNVSHLPTFNSSSIEMALPNISELSDYFIYLNDDTLFFSPLEKERFFMDNLPVDFLNHGWIPRGKLFEKLVGKDTWVNSLNNNLTLINKHFSLSNLDSSKLYAKTYLFKNKLSNFLLKNVYKKYFWFEHWHHPIPYLKKTLLEVKEKCFDEMQICSANRFRHNTDLTQYLYRYWRLAKGEFFPCKYDDGFETNIDSIEKLDKAIAICDSTKPKFVCLNDSPSLSNEDFEIIKEKLLNYLSEYFPGKASFEL